MHGEETWLLLKTTNMLGRTSNNLGPRPSGLSLEDLIFREEKSAMCLTELLIARGQDYTSDLENPMFPSIEAKILSPRLPHALSVMILRYTVSPFYNTA